jgi:hypothetical protein
MAQVPARQELLPPKEHGWWGNITQENRTSDAINLAAAPYIPPQWEMTSDQLRMERPQALPQVMQFAPRYGYERGAAGIEDMFEMAARTPTAWQAGKWSDYTGASGGYQGSSQNYTTLESSGWG